MNRLRLKKIKREVTEASTSSYNAKEEHDLAYYIHDRVDLMHQVFSILKSKEIKSILPDCVRNVPIGDLQELCTEELLGISSKRLLAILDGAEPPTDTESSGSLSPKHLETISLDSISSDEEILSQNSSKKGRKHKHRNKKKHKHKKAKDKESPAADKEETDKSKASRAGLTVLELLELQARARAIRAQLHQHRELLPEKSSIPAESSSSSSDDEIEIKEEPADIVEIISSEDEKPNALELQKCLEKNRDLPQPVNHHKQVSPAKQQLRQEKDKCNEIVKDDSSKTVTKRINDLIITVPQAKPSRKIKLNRNKVTVSLANVSSDTNEITLEPNKNITPAQTGASNHAEFTKKIEKNKSKKEKSNKKENRKKIRKQDTEKSDDEMITLQLSDSEKMDLLEDFDKNYDKASDSCTEDSESSSSSNDNESYKSETIINENINKTEIDFKVNVDELHKTSNIKSIKSRRDQGETDTQNIETADNAKQKNYQNIESKKEYSTIETDNTIQSNSQVIINENNSLNSEVINSKLSMISSNTNESRKHMNSLGSISEELKEKDIIDIPKLDINIISEEIEVSNISANLVLGDSECGKDVEESKNKCNNLSDGEISEKDCSEVEALDSQLEVVCISDEDTSLANKTLKIKKDKKSKKQKKAKKKKEFCKESSQNVHKDLDSLSENIDLSKSEVEVIPKINEDLNSKTRQSYLEELDDHTNEIFELSDTGSSCYEVEGVSILSKEPTVEEIVALSEKIDQIQQNDVVTDTQSKQSVPIQENDIILDQNVENVSWKDRYLDSKKVKKVLTTSNIINALRKKNKELKKKLEESKNEFVNTTTEIETIKDNTLVDGSVQQFDTLKGSNKYVDPVLDQEDIKKRLEEHRIQKEEERTKDLLSKMELNVTGEMKKDAKQLLKMYKKLLKFNETKTKTVKKKKKPKKNKEKHKDSATKKITVDVV